MQLRTILPNTYPTPPYQQLLKALFEHMQLCRQPNLLEPTPPTAILASRQLAFGKVLINGMGNPQNRNLL